MSECWYCEKEVEFGQNHPDQNVHSWCKNERDRRVDAQECVFCNEPLGAEELEIGSIKHESCRVAGIYSGYDTL